DEHRTVNREVLDATSLTAALSDPASRTSRVWAGISRLLAERARHQALAPNGKPLEVVTLDTSAVLGARLTSADATQSIISLINVSADRQSVSLPLEHAVNDVFTSKRFPSVRRTCVVPLMPYQVAWLATVG
ncbi:MAG: hypothetical protein KDD69_14000, partial [Bdellovibrionales bacterium]|nr:hypothetical protein [Bdellovibrionales bacterium]